MVNKRLGIMVFGNHSGLGMQTKRLSEMLNPHKVMLIDMRGLSKNRELHKEWYSNYGGYIVSGFPSDREVRKFLNEIDVLLLCENPMNKNLTRMAKRIGVKVIIQENWEFNDFLIDKTMELPDLFLVPSHWHLRDMESIFGKDRVMYLPPPLNNTAPKLIDVRDHNLNMHNDKIKMLHVVGTLAAEDRNGTQVVLSALEYMKDVDFELVIHSQQPLPNEYIVSDSRVTYRVESFDNEFEVYRGFDFMALPRRYGGLCLPMWEALAVGIPVIMTDIEPNDSYLPFYLRIPAKPAKQIKTRAMIDVYDCDPQSAADIIMGEIEFMQDERTRRREKNTAVEIARQVSFEVLKPRYEGIICE